MLTIAPELSSFVICRVVNVSGTLPLVSTQIPFGASVDQLVSCRSASVGHAYAARRLGRTNSREARPVDLHEFHA